jgi:predicted alpha/beta hydrolase family esterase
VRSTVLFVPGLRGHVADHWQTLLAESLPGSRTVPPLEQNGLSRAARVEVLNTTLQEIEGAVILAAHSAGCMTVVHWAQLYDRPIKGALLATPADIATPLPAGYPTFEDLSANGWLPISDQPLPFRSILAASSNDPLASGERLAEMARGWGSELALVGAVGHLNPASGFGHWPDAMAFLESLD